MTVRILIGDVRERLAELPDQSVQMCCTSPPYFGLRDYGVPGQLGLEPTLSEYISTMVDVFREVRRVLHDTGVLFLNIGDSYASNPASGCERYARPQDKNPGEYQRTPNLAWRRPDGLKPKDLMMVPARLAIALCDDGWYLRSDIIWHKRAPMPESVTDRPTSAHEHIFLLTKQSRYFYDADAVREDTEPYRMKEPDGWDTGPGAHGTIHRNGRGDGKTQEGMYSGRNMRNVWTLSPEPYPDAHFATYPTEIPRRAIRAGTSEKGCCSACGAPYRRVVEREAVARTLNGGRNGFRVDQIKAEPNKGTSSAGHVNTQTTGWEPTCQCDAEVVPCTVLDPFVGSGTTLLVADQLERNGIGIELNPEYAEMARQRVYGASPLFATVEVS